MSTLPASLSGSRGFMREDLITVRKVSRSNADDAILLIEEYYGEVGVLVRDNRETLLRLLDEPQTGIWVAYAGEIPAGCVMLRPLANHSRSGEVKRLYVRSDYRGQGIAESLMQALEENAKRSGMQWLYLDTKDDLKPAIRFYERHGYCRCDRYNDNPQATIFMRKQIANEEVFVRTFHPGDEHAFRVLNEAWISTYFAIEERDREVLDNPVDIILKRGGQILFAICGDKAIGCCALVPMEDGSFEVSKMTVEEQERGHGVGRKILQAVVDYAKNQGIRRLYLETNDRLKNAIHLYEELGFKHIPEENRVPSPYSRANVFMDMYL